MGWKERFKEWMKKDTAKEIVGPIVADYDLKQCVELKNKITRHQGKTYLIAVPLCLFMEVIAVAYISIMVGLADIGLIEVAENDTSGLAFVFLGVLVLAVWFGYTIFLTEIIGRINKRIEELAGVSDGTQKKD